MTTPARAFGSLTGKTALITGASSGIGRAIALEFAAAGANVLVHYASSRQQAEEVAKSAQQLGVQAQTVRADFAQGSIDDFLSDLDRLDWPINLLVNNAGADLLTGSGATLPFPEKLQRLWEVDVRSTVLLSRAVGQRMKQAGRGAILNLGWDQADRGMEGDSAELFSTAKNAIMGVSRSLAVSLAPEVRVNCIAPGWIQTAWGAQASDDWQQRVLRETPLRRWGKPEDIAKLARFLASDDASYLTGQVINANGGAIR